MNQNLKIKDIRAFVIESGVGTDYTSQEEGHWISDSLISNPMSIYPEYHDSRNSWGIGVLGSAIVEVELENGVIGIGLSTGGHPACWLIENHLKRFAIDRYVHEVERIWDQMWRSSMPYGRKGLTIHAISAIDLGLWDAFGRALELPVWALLGGKVRDELPVYATTPNVTAAAKLGFYGGKLPLAHGPADGNKGLAENIRQVATVREVVGDEFDIMLDCYMSLNIEYTVALARQLAPYNICWIEEPLPPDDIDGYVELKKRLPTTTITTGEHEYTRYGFRELISRKAADILQPDILWCGGITEVRRIVAMASAYDIPVIPHGSSIFSFHVQMAFPNCLMGEFLILSPDGDQPVPQFGSLFKNEPVPLNGLVQLSDNPGFGVELNRTSIDLTRPYLVN